MPPRCRICGEHHSPTCGAAHPYLDAVAALIDLVSGPPFRAVPSLEYPDAIETTATVDGVRELGR
jgi:hypothetical protein